MRQDAPVMRHFVRVLLLAGFALLLLPASADAAAGETILTVDLDAPVTPVAANIIADAIADGASGGHVAVLLRLDTPGGLDASMRDIVTAILNAEVPVIAWVGPSGARAASAGYIVLSAAHVNAMAPGTTTGASTPIDLEGGEVLDKVVNDAASYAIALAELRGRDVAFAEDAVRDGRSASADEARELGVVDLLADNVPDLLEVVDGRHVELASGEEITLATSGVTLVTHETSLFRRALQFVADPNLAFLFFSIGTLAIVYELVHPGIGLSGTIGVILLLIALFALAVLPVNWVGVALLVLALGLFIGELFAPGIGALAGGGALSLLLAGLFLFERPSGVRVSLGVLIPVVVVAGLGTAGLAVLAARTRNRPPLTGADSLLGRRAVVRRADGNTGQVFVAGALWQARSLGAPLNVGEVVEVVDRDELELIVVRQEVVP